MSLKASIVIPAYNSANRIHIPLEQLVKQTAANGSFEVVVIDNASNDGTSDIVKNHWIIAALQERNIECRVVRENRKGLTYARIRGVRESRGLFVCFLDDDNAPDEDYVAQGIAAFSDESIGLLVSRIYPKYESVFPSPSMEKREHLLAINEKMGDIPIEWESTVTIAPTIGAGMWIRRSAFLMTVPWQSPNLLLSDRQGNSLASGGDIEIGILLGKGGFKRLYCPNLRLHHVIPNSRLKTKYFCNLIIGVVRSTLTVEKKYIEKKYNFFDRCVNFIDLILATFALPLLLLRRDGWRESLFVMVACWAKLMGPYKQKLDC